MMRELSDILTPGKGPTFNKEQYEEEIKNIRAVMQQSVDEQQTLIKVCNDKKLEVQQVLEFFGQDKVASVVKASPKLHDPSEQAAGNPSS